MSNDAKVVFTYTREQALEDGVLVDVSKLASECGFTFPVAITSDLHGTLQPPEEVAGLQSYEGRLWDVLWMLSCTIKGMLPAKDRFPYGGGECIFFELMIVDSTTPKKCGPDPWGVTLKAISGPGDNQEPVITIMLPHED